MMMEFTVQSEQAWFILGPQWNGNRASAIVAGSITHFQGAPGIGTFFKFDVPIGSIGGNPVAVGILQWPGLFLWEPDDWKNDGVENPEPVFVGYYGDVHARIGPVGLIYSFFNFLDEPWNELSGVSYTVNARENLSISASATWNNNKERWMLWMGATWLINR
jgi:hypothetical protein